MSAEEQDTTRRERILFTGWHLITCDEECQRWEDITNYGVLFEGGYPILVGHLYSSTNKTLRRNIVVERSDALELIEAKHFRRSEKELENVFRQLQEIRNRE